MNELTHSRLKELLNYDPNTGLFTWKISHGNRLAGSCAGTTNLRGYVAIKVNEKLCWAHRLAWFFSYGVWPAKHIDHINGIRTDNRISNLRQASCRENMQNMAVHRNGKLAGTTYRQDLEKWVAKVWFDIGKGKGKHIYLGLFNTEIEAHEAYMEALSNPEETLRKKKGPRGYHKHGRRWRACIWIDGKSKHLGCFVSEAEANEAYKTALLKKTLEKSS